MDVAETSGFNRFIAHDPDGPYAYNAANYPEHYRILLGQLTALPFPERYKQVLRIRSDGLANDPYLLVVQAWLHIQMYEEVGSLDLLRKAQRTVSPLADPLVDERILELQHWCEEQSQEHRAAWAMPSEGYKRFSQTWHSVREMVLPDHGHLQFRIDEIHKKWAKLHQTPTTIDFDAYYARYLSIQSSEMEGVFKLSGASTARLVRLGLYTGAVETVAKGGVYGSDQKAVVVDICRDYVEALNEIMAWSKHGTPIGTNELGRLHRIVLRNASIQSMEGTYVLTPGGVLRATIVTAGDIVHEDAEVQFCPPWAVETELDKLWKLYAEYLKQHSGDLYKLVGVAAWIHVSLAVIHPFADGNGRVCRLISSIPLIAASLPPISISAEHLHKERYILALQKAAMTGDLSSLMSTILDCMDASMDYIIANSLPQEDDNLYRLRSTEAAPRVRLSSRVFKQPKMKTNTELWA